MHELIRTSDLVLISAVEAHLAGAGFRFVVADRHISAIEAGVIAFPVRVLVEDDQATPARRLLADAGFAAELRPLKP